MYGKVNIDGHEVYLDGPRYAIVSNPKTDVIYEISRPFYNIGKQLIEYQGAGGSVRMLRVGGPKHKQISDILQKAIAKKDKPNDQ